GQLRVAAGLRRHRCQPLAGAERLAVRLRARLHPKRRGALRLRLRAVALPLDRARSGGRAPARRLPEPPDVDRRRLPAGARGASALRPRAVSAEAPAPDDHAVPAPAPASHGFRPFHAWITLLTGLAFMGNGLDLSVISFSLPGMRAELGLTPAQ